MLAGQRHSEAVDEMPPSMSDLNVSDFLQFLNSNYPSSKPTLLDMHHSQVFCVPCISCSKLPRKTPTAFVIICRHMYQKNSKLDQHFPVHKQEQEGSFDDNSPKTLLSKKEHDDAKLEEQDSYKTQHSKHLNVNRAMIREKMKTDRSFTKIDKESINSIELEDVKGLKQAVKSLSVNASTFKRTARQHMSASWRSCSAHARVQKDRLITKGHIHESAESMESAIRGPQTPMEDLTIKCLKVKFGNDVIKLEISTSSKLVDLEEEIAKRLKLKIGSFRIKYMDEEQDLIMVTCDADLSCCMKFSNTKLIIMVVYVNLDPSDDCICANNY